MPRYEYLDLKWLILIFTQNLNILEKNINPYLVTNTVVYKNIFLIILRLLLKIQDLWTLILFCLFAT